MISEVDSVPVIDKAIDNGYRRELIIRKLDRTEGIPSVCMQIHSCKGDWLRKISKYEDSNGFLSKCFIEIYSICSAKHILKYMTGTLKAFSFFL